MHSTFRLILLKNRKKNHRNLTVFAIFLVKLLTYRYNLDRIRNLAEKIGAYFRKAHTPFLLKSWILTYFDVLNTNMTMKIAANDIFKIRQSTTLKSRLNLLRTGLASILATHKLGNSTQDVHSIYIDGFNVKIKVDFKGKVPVLRRLMSTFRLKSFDTFFLDQNFSKNGTAPLVKRHLLKNTSLRV